MPVAVGHHRAGVAVAVRRQDHDDGIGEQGVMPLL